MLFLKLFTFFEKTGKLLLEEVRGHMSLGVLSENITEANAKLHYSSNRQQREHCVLANQIYCVMFE